MYTPSNEQKKHYGHKTKRGWRQGTVTCVRLEFRFVEIVWETQETNLSLGSLGFLSGGWYHKQKGHLFTQGCLFSPWDRVSLCSFGWPAATV